MPEVYIIRYHNEVEVSQWVTICSLLQIDYRIVDYRILNEDYNKTVILDTSAPCHLEILKYRGIFCLQDSHPYLNSSPICIQNIDVSPWIPLFKNVYFRDKLTIKPTWKSIKPNYVQEVLAHCRYQPIIASNNNVIISSFSIGKTLANKDINEDYYVFLYFAQNLVEYMFKKEISDKSEVKVLLSFDTEGYTPLSNKALEIILDCLKKRDIKGCFNFVGKKIEYIKSTSPYLIKRMKKHFISYHTYSHSEHPTLVEYSRVDNGGITKALQNFSEAEYYGINLIKDSFKVKYLGFAFPGDVYVPYVPIFTRKKNKNSFLLYTPLKLFGYHFLDGILDFGAAHIDLDLYLSGSLSTLQIALLRDWVQIMRGGGGILILRIHPDRLLQRGAWDLRDITTMENRSEEEVLQIFRNLDEIIDFLKKLPNTGFICLESYVKNAKPSTFTITKSEIIDLVNLITNGYYTRIVHGHSLSLLDVLFIVSTSFYSILENGYIPEMVTVKHTNIEPYKLEFNELIKVKIKDLIIANAKILNCFNNDEVLPATFWIGNENISLSMILLALVKVINIYTKSREIPLMIQAEKNFPKQKWIDEALMKFPYMWKWPVLPKGFSAPEHVTFAKSQFFWCMKPFLLDKVQK